MAPRHQAPGREHGVARPVDRPFVMVLAGAKDGAPWAFRHIVDELGRPVAGYLRGQGAEDPDGLTNEVFLRAFRRIDRFVGDDRQFRSWVFTLARNALIDERRRARRRVATVNLTSSVEPPSDRDVAAEAVAAADNEVAALLEGLTGDQREILLLRVAADLSVEQVARVTGRSGAAVRALQHRAVASLRRMFAA